MLRKERKGPRHTYRCKRGGGFILFGLLTISGGGVLCVFLGYSYVEVPTVTQRDVKGQARYTDVVRRHEKHRGLYRRNGEGATSRGCA